MAVRNSTILAKAWLEGSSDFQQRVPAPTVATQKQMMEAIFSPENGSRIYNEFIEGTLLNRIGLTYAHQQSWRNPLGVFKRKLDWGASVQELAFAWVKAHAYRDDAQTLLKVHRPEIEQAIHTITREDQYPISINKMEIKRAAVNDFGLNAIVAGAMDSVTNSEQYDEFLQMKELIAWYENTWGFFKIHGDLPDDDTSGKAFLKSLRTMINRLRFPSTLYNAGIVDDIPVAVKPDELVLLIDGAAEASVSVDTLAMLFHLEKADVQVRKIVLDEFPIPGAYALLTTPDWFQVYDETYENSSFWNAETLTTTYYLTVAQIISCSPFVPAILWTTDEGTETGSITQTTDMTLTPGVYTRNAFGAYEPLAEGTKVTEAMITGKRADGLPNDVDGVYVLATLNGSLSGLGQEDVQQIQGVMVKPNGYVATGYEYSGTSGVPVANTATRLDRLGRLHLQKGAYRGEDITLTVTLVTTYTNPSGETSAAVPSTVEIAIAGDGDEGGGGDDPGDG